jgi:hypothetical protein
MVSTDIGSFTKEQVSSKEADGFFESPNLTDKAKDVFREVKRRHTPDTQ